MKHNRIKTITRIVALTLAALLAGSALLSVLSYVVWGAPGDDGLPYNINFTEMTHNDRNGYSVSNLKSGQRVDITITFKQKITGVNAGDEVDTSRNTLSCLIAGGFRSVSSSSTRTTLTVVQYDSANNIANMQLNITNVEYKSPPKTLIVRDMTGTLGSYNLNNMSISIDVPESYFDGSSGSSSGDYETPTSYTSQIVVENAVARDSSGNRIDEVTEDTPSFTLEIVFADMGLQNADLDDVGRGDIQAFLKNGASFESSDSTRGSVTVTSKAGDYPRFRATFTGVKYTGVGKEAGFAVFYKFDDLALSVAGEGSAILTAAKAKEEDKDEDDKKMGISVPKIIISSYSYGEDTIEAGNEFALSFTVQNTSNETPVENIVVTLTPASNEAATKGPGLIVASSSNTIYVPEIEAGGSRSYTVSFQARPDAEVTSHLITVQFSYEYVDENLKSREKVPDLSESIAIPVSQIDRFVLEPILETVYAQLGEEAYLTVNFINRGKSSVNNIYGTVKTESPAITAPGQAYGHLEAGKPDSLDMYLTSTEPGEFSGEVVIQYEDENNNVKELSTPFTMYVEEPWYPPMEEELPPGGMDGMDGMEGPPPPGIINIVMCVLGAVAIAVPIALYLMKRVKARGNEDLDEDF